MPPDQTNKARRIHACMTMEAVALAAAAFVGRRFFPQARAPCNCSRPWRGEVERALRIVVVHRTASRLLTEAGHGPLMPELHLRKAPDTANGSRVNDFTKTEEITICRPFYRSNFPVSEFLLGPKIIEEAPGARLLDPLLFVPAPA